MIFKLLAVLAMAAFYGVYFYKVYEQKQKGIKTDNIIGDKAGMVRYLCIGLKVVTIALPITQLLCIFRNKSLLPAPLRVIGFLVALAGAGVFAAAVFTMRDNWRVGVPEDEVTQLVTDGVYSYSRNPAFVGFDLMYIGILLMFFNVGLFLFTAAAVALFHFYIVNVEEDYLTAAFGESYVEYKSRVGRYFGKGTD